MIEHRIEFSNYRAMNCGCQLEYSSGHGEYSEGHSVHLCPRHDTFHVFQILREVYGDLERAVTPADESCRAALGSAMAVIEQSGALEEQSDERNNT